MLVVLVGVVTVVVVGDAVDKVVLEKEKVTTGLDLGHQRVVGNG